MGEREAEAGTGSPRAKYLTSGGSVIDGEPVVTLTRGQMRQLVRDAVAAELGAQRSLLVDKQGLAQRLNCSASTVDALRKEGLPTVRLLGAVRFEPEAVVAWLRGRQGENDS